MDIHIFRVKLIEFPLDSPCPLLFWLKGLWLWFISSKKHWKMLSERCQNANRQSKTSDVEHRGSLTKGWADASRLAADFILILL